MHITMVYFKKLFLQVKILIYLNQNENLISSTLIYLLTFVLTNGFFFHLSILIFLLLVLQIIHILNRILLILLINLLCSHIFFSNNQIRLLKHISKTLQLFKNLYNSNSIKLYSKFYHIYSL